MKKTDFTTYKFRASSLPAIMTHSRNGDPLAETTKAYLREIWIAEVFGREKYDVKTKYLDKGIACESDSLDLVKKVTKQTYFKNQKQFENEWIKGTPDLILSTNIIDIKTSWDIWTFAKVDGNLAEKSYYYQLMGYMWLTEKKEADLIYCLVNTPENIIQDELYKISFKFPEVSEKSEEEARFRKNYIFDDIPAELRMKKYHFSFSNVAVEQLKYQITAAREYLSGLTL